MFELTTDRLRLRRFTPDDAEFIVRLLNEDDFLRYIGDKGVRKEADARRYLADGPIASYDRHGFGLYCVERMTDGEPLGMCGLLKRDHLPDPDLGFALLEEHRRLGITEEAAREVLRHECLRHDLSTVLAITHPENRASIGLLEKLGFRLAKSGSGPTAQSAGQERPEGGSVLLFVRRV